MSELSKYCLSFTAAEPTAGTVLKDVAVDLVSHMIGAT